MKKTEDPKGKEPSNTITELGNTGIKQSGVQGDRILRPEKAADKVGLSRPQIWRMVNRASPAYCPDFPQPVRLCSNAVGWRESQLDAWIANLSYD